MKKLPKTTGVYLFYGNSKTPIYIGKAVNISNRARSHHDFFMDKVKRVGFIETNSEIEALILEANLIKKYQPKYNVMWRDDKKYFYVVIALNKNNLPYVFITHQPQARCIGPFTEGIALKKTLRFLRRVFPYYTNSKHPKTNCTWCHLDLCPGPNPNIKKYKSDIKKLVLILQGKKGRVLGSSKQEMNKFSREKRFEEAGKIRDRIYNLQQILSHTHVINHPVHNLSDSVILGQGRFEAYDVSNIQGKFATGSMVVFINGQPDKSQYKKFKIKGYPLGHDKLNDIAMLKEILARRFSHPEWPHPNAILIDGGKAQLNIAIRNKAPGVKVFSIAKGKQELFVESRAKPIPLKDLPQETKNLILCLDSEAHRFALAYHKKLRKKNLLV